MTESESPLEVLAEKIIECANRVHSNFGPGFPEKAYHDALRAELKKAKLQFKTEETIVAYVNGAQIGAKRTEIMVENIMVELKSLPRIEIPHVVLFSNGLKKSNLDMGLLIDFGSQKIQVKKRLANKVVEVEEED